MNDASLFAKLIFRILGASHPIRLAIGISLATIMKMSVGAIDATYPQPGLTYLNSYAAWWYMLAFTPLVYVPMLFGKKGAPEVIVHQINAVDAMLEKADLSKNDKKMMWRALVNNYITHAKPDLSRTPNLTDLAELELKSSQEPSAPA